MTSKAIYLIPMSPVWLGSYIIMHVLRVFWETKCLHETNETIQR